jgi:peptidoglycan/xylan/chitin deacetylase (PgdA/CDA1 family)
MKIIFRVLSFVFLLIFLAGILVYTTPLPGNIPVLMYHFIGEPPEGLNGGNYVSKENFSKQMAFLDFFGYRVITLDDYYQIKTRQKKGSGREIVITFDDGDLSFLKEALPVLEKYKFPVTIFLISAKVPTGEDHSLSLAMIKDLQEKYSWIDFQAHTKTHPHLKDTPDSQLKEEIFVAKRELEQMLGKPMPYMAYPFGEPTQRIIDEIEKAGYRMAFATSHAKLRGLPEGFFCQTRIKVDPPANNLFAFWSYVSGLYSTFKEIRYRTHYNL